MGTSARRPRAFSGRNLADERSRSRSQPGRVGHKMVCSSVEARAIGQEMYDEGGGGGVGVAFGGWTVDA